MIYHMSKPARALTGAEMPLVEGIYSIKAREARDKWFVIFTAPQYERRVCQALVARAVSHYLPRARRWKRQSRRAKHQREPKRHVTEPLLTRYVFAELPADELHFGRITDLDGVHSILSDSKGPVFVREDLVKEIARREEAGEFDDTRPYVVQTNPGGEDDARTSLARGWRARRRAERAICQLPRHDQEIVSSEKLTVGIMIFGRTAPVKLHIDQIEEL